MAGTIFANYARMSALMASLIALLAAGGWMLGGVAGLIALAGLGLLVCVASALFADELTLRAHRTRPLSRHEAPQLFAMTEELARRFAIPPPRLQVIPSGSPNALTVRRGRGRASIAVTEGLLELLDGPQLEAVLAHEMSHLRSGDAQVATAAAGLAGSFAWVGHTLQWILLMGGTAGRGDQRGSGFAPLAWLPVAPVIAVILRLALPRRRESLADASGAQLVGDPAALAAALDKILAWSKRRPYAFAGPATGHLFILNPLRRMRSRLLSGLSLHPPTHHRIARLQALHA
jgi:heat shock protein HtpX